MGSIEIPFDIGQKVWWARNERTTERLECPECAGQLRVKLTLGNGEEYHLECRACQVEHHATGYIRRNAWEPTPIEVTIESVHSWDGLTPSLWDVDAPGEWKLARHADLYAERDLAEIRAKAIRAEQEANQERIHLHNITEGRSDQAFSVHYWRRRLRKCREEVAVCEKWLGIAKEEAKANKETTQ